MFQQTDEVMSKFASLAGCVVLETLTKLKVRQKRKHFNARRSVTVLSLVFLLQHKKTPF